MRYTKNSGAHQRLNDVYERKGPKFESTKFTSMLEPLYNCETVVGNSDILVVGMSSVEMFSNKTKTWSKNFNCVIKEVPFACALPNKTYT